MIKYNNDNNDNNDNNINIINIEYNKILVEFNNFIKIHLLPIIEKYKEPLENNIYYNDYENNDIKKSIICLSQLSTTKNILDISFHSGFTALLFLISNSNITVTSIDIVNYSYVIPCYLKIKEYFKNRINLIWGNSKEELKNIKNLKYKFDIVNIDGSIYTEIISQDIQNSMLLANKNAYFILRKNMYKLFNNNIITKNFDELIKDKNEKIFIYKYINEIEDGVLRKLPISGEEENKAENKAENEAENEDISLFVNNLNEEINEEKIFNPIIQKNKNIPRGSWIESSQNYYIKNNYLYTELKLANGLWNSNCIKVSDIAYENNNGNLEPIKIYISLEQNNLSYCLRVISSLFIISKYYGYNIYIGYDTLNNLDKKNREIIYYLFYNILKKTCNQKYEKLDFNDYIKKDYLNLINQGRFTYLPNNSFTITNNIYNIIPGNMTEKNFIKEKVQFYKSLMYPSFLIDDINIFFSKYNLSEYIGIYIENTENIENNSYLLKIYADKIFEYRKKNNKIIIFSNNEEINDFFIEENYIIKPNKCSYNIYQELYEIILLSKTKLIITFEHSIFPCESAFFEGNNIEIYKKKDKKWIICKLKE